jgi:hypothetical protein
MRRDLLEGIAKEVRPEPTHDTTDRGPFADQADVDRIWQKSELDRHSHCAHDV